MIENRRFYRLPNHARFVLATSSQVFTGKSVNVSLGGAFVHVLDVTGIQSGEQLHCNFMLHDNSSVLGCTATVRRIALETTNPGDPSGFGIEFTNFTGDSKRALEEYILEQKRIYELLGTLLMNTEPDLRSIRPLLSKLPITRQPDLRDLRIYVESALRSIQMVERKVEPSPPPPL